MGASAKRGDKNSWLAVVVERAEWKDHTLPLRAFISAQIVMLTANRQRPPDGATDPNTAATTPRAARRQSVRAAARSDPELSNLILTPQNASEKTSDEPGIKHPLPENVGILRGKDGTTYLLSTKSNVKLPAGVLPMLINEPFAKSEIKEGLTTSASSAQPRP